MTQPQIEEPLGFNPAGIRAVMNGTAPRGLAFAILTSQTCGEPCWHAREEVCRCSCGGRNHGCLTHGGERPERHSKIDGIAYKLAGVGPRDSLCGEAERINKESGFRSLEAPRYIIGGSQKPFAEWAAAKANGAECWVAQYHYTWKETDSGAPARIKYPSATQRKWTEFAAFVQERDAALLWVRVEMPQRPTQLRVDSDGKPLANQNPE